MTSGPQQGVPQPLPALREELKLIPGRTNAQGERSWRIYDPLQHRFIEVDSLTVDMLALWRSVKDAEALKQELETAHNVSVSSEAIDELISFAHANYLTAEPPRGDWKGLSERTRGERAKWGKWLLHNYLFFRIPLVKPQAFLVATLPLVEPLFNRWVQRFFALLGLIGLFLVSRQWDQFANTFQHFFNWTGAIWFGLTLFLVKALHELGHAYTAVRFGCQVPAMGAAFMLLTPMLYTDVTDAWRLPSRRQRMKIDFAGVAVELMIACTATFLWSFLPEGKLKSLAFLLATSSLFMSLMINLSPFMRFDGYFILADLVGIPNLQPRSFEVARWRIREWLFALKAPCPEDMLPATITGMTIYAFATLIYRFVLYIGIAVLVYYYFFKALGILLFVIEVFVFLVNPVVWEFKEWFKMKKAILASKRLPYTLGVTAALILALLVPWSSRVDIPVVIEPDELVRVYPPRPAVIAAVHAKKGDVVSPGTPLVSLRSEDLEHQIRLVQTEIARVKAKLARLTVDDADREISAISRREMASLAARHKGLLKEKSELEIVAPSGGTLVEFNADLHAGRTLGQQEMIALIGGSTSLTARGYIAEKDIWRLKEGDTGKVIPEDGLRSGYQVSIRDISPAGAHSVEIADLASTNGGRIAVQPDSKKQLIPIGALYPVTLDIVDMQAVPEVRIRGVAQISGAPESFAARVWRRTMMVLIRESGA